MGSGSEAHNFWGGDKDLIGNFYVMMMDWGGVRVDVEYVFVGISIR
jgi:hypothetical protein